MKYNLVLIACFVCHITFAQDWDLGAKAGVNVSWGEVKNFPIDLSSAMGFHVGAYGNTPINDQLRIQPELLLSVYGWKSETINEKRTLSYLSIPVVVKYYLLNNFNLHAGPQLSFLIDASDDFDDLLKSTDFGVLFGAEYNITESLGLGFRYNLGISNVLDTPETDIKIKSRVLHFSAFYKLSR